MILIESRGLINPRTCGDRVFGALFSGQNFTKIVNKQDLTIWNSNFPRIFRPETDTNMNLYCPSSFIITILWCKSWIQMHICTYLAFKPSIALSSGGFYYFSNFAWVLKTVPITGRPQALRFINSSTYLTIIPNCQSWIWTNIC